MSLPESQTLDLRPIGYVRTASQRKFDAPSQPNAGGDEVNTIELLPGHQFELALHDLAGFDRIWLVWWFHRNEHWRPTVMPPRGPAKRRGVFATRSPHRPNPIGLTCVSLLSVRGLVLEVGPLDLLDGTPILDIKPYLRTVDAYPESGLGWLESVEAAEQSPPAFRVEVNSAAELELIWLRENWEIDFTERAFAILERDPTPHRTRRVLKVGPNRYRIACGAWRMFYRIEEDRVVIENIEKGYSDETLASHRDDKMLDREAQIAFAAWKQAEASDQEPDL
jgi:tRNA-Thr(GGU) m(6)t(6)A37 methyltransferase TsaA